MFVVVALIFTLLMYVVYIFTAFPMLSDEPGSSNLVQLFSILAVFNTLSAVLVFCQIISAARRMLALSAEYGKVVKIQGYVFFVGNCVSALVYYQWSMGALYFWKWNFFASTAFQLIFFGITELAPLLSCV